MEISVSKVDELKEIIFFTFAFAPSLCPIYLLFIFFSSLYVSIHIIEKGQKKKNGIENFVFFEKNLDPWISGGSPFPIWAGMEKKDKTPLRIRAEKSSKIGDGVIHLYYPAQAASVPSYTLHK